MVAGTESHRAFLVFSQALSFVSYPAMKKMVRLAGFPPAVSRLSSGRFGVLSYRRELLAAARGFAPQSPGSEPGVLLVELHGIF